MCHVEKRRETPQQRETWKSLKSIVWAEPMEIEEWENERITHRDVLNELEPDNPREVSLEKIPRASSSEIFSN